MVGMISKGFKLSIFDTKPGFDQAPLPNGKASAGGGRRCRNCSFELCQGHFPENTSSVLEGRQNVCLPPRTRQLPAREGLAALRCGGVCGVCVGGRARTMLTPLLSRTHVF